MAVVAILDRLERRQHHWPVGRIMFQKLVYFATQAGIPTGLDYRAASYGPYATDLKRMVARLQNNGLAIEQQRGETCSRSGSVQPIAMLSHGSTIAWSLGGPPLKGRSISWPG